MFFECKDCATQFEVGCTNQVYQRIGLPYHDEFPYFLILLDEWGHDVGMKEGFQTTQEAYKYGTQVLHLQPV